MTHVIGAVWAHTSRKPAKTDLIPSQKEKNSSKDSIEKGVDADTNPNGTKRKYPRLVLKSRVCEPWRKWKRQASGEFSGGGGFILEDHMGLRLAPEREYWPTTSLKMVLGELYLR